MHDIIMDGVDVTVDSPLLNIKLQVSLDHLHLVGWSQKSKKLKSEDLAGTTGISTVPMEDGDDSKPSVAEVGGTCPHSDYAQREQRECVIATY